VSGEGYLWLKFLEERLGQLEYQVLKRRLQHAHLRHRQRMWAHEAAQAIPAPKDPPQLQRGLLGTRVGSALSTERVLEVLGKVK
jgi:hypothetical protein